jgi:hypothetical protein
MIHYQNGLIASGIAQGTSQLDIAGRITIEGMEKMGQVGPPIATGMAIVEFGPKVRRDLHLRCP